MGEIVANKTDTTEPASTWPKRADGSNMTIGEMTREQAREQFRLAGWRLKRSMEGPEMQKRMAEILS